MTRQKIASRVGRSFQAGHRIARGSLTGCPRGVSLCCVGSTRGCPIRRQRRGGFHSAAGAVSRVRGLCAPGFRQKRSQLFCNYRLRHVDSSSGSPRQRKVTGRDRPNMKRGHGVCTHIGVYNVGDVNVLKKLYFGSFLTVVPTSPHCRGYDNTSCARMRQLICRALRGCRTALRRTRGLKLFDCRTALPFPLLVQGLKKLRAEFRGSVCSNTNFLHALPPPSGAAH